MPAWCREGEPGSKAGQTQPHASLQPLQTLSGRSGEATNPAGDSPLRREVHKLLGEVVGRQLGRRLLHHLLELLEGGAPGLVGEAENGQLDLGTGTGRRETSGSPPPHAARRLRGCSGLRFRMKTLFPYQQFSIWVMLPFFFFLLFKYKNPEAKNTSF